MSPYAIDSDVVETLREKTKLAKKVFTLSFVNSQAVKDKSWIQQNASATDLPFDDYTAEEMSSNSGTNQKKLKELVIAQRKLKSLLEDVNAPASSILANKTKTKSTSKVKAKKASCSVIPARKKGGFVVINPGLM